MGDGVSFTHDVVVAGLLSQRHRRSSGGITARNQEESGLTHENCHQGACGLMLARGVMGVRDVVCSPEATRLSTTTVIVSSYWFSMPLPQTVF